MMASKKTVYLISGTNRGLGLGFVKNLIERDDVIIFAGVREPTNATELQTLANEHPEKLHIVKLVSADETGNKATIEEIKTKVGRLDVVIANAAFDKPTGPALEVSLQDMRDHYEVNVIGPLALFQTSYPLLKASTSAPKFIVISSRIGSITIGAAMPGGGLPYRSSKAALNYLARKLHFENDGLIVLPLCPGAVDTDMFAPYKDTEFTKSMKISSAEKVASGLLSIIDGATRLENGPAFHTIDGDVAPW